MEGQSSRDVITAVLNGKPFVFTFDKQLTANLAEAVAQEHESAER